MPVAYGATLAFVTLAALGWMLTLAGSLMWRADALVVLFLALGLAALRALARRHLVLKLWDRGGLAENRPLLLADWAVAPIALIVNAACGWSALRTSRTTWAGITYEVRGPRHVDVLARASAAHR